ncbi:MAG TPA: type II secretion system protein [Phycisphaerales bacterium]|nr:type II secretion system protein [Phycisphaerales bacterium]
MVRNATARRTRRRAFSLLELMLVVAIMGILMAVVGFNVLGSGERAKKRATEATLKNVQTALKAYHLEQSAFPPDLQLLITTKHLDNVKLADGWGTALIYNPTAASTAPDVDQPYQLGSAGADKNPGTADDISVWTINR